MTFVCTWRSTLFFSSYSHFFSSLFHHRSSILNVDIFVCTNNLCNLWNIVLPICETNNSCSVSSQSNSFRLGGISYWLGRELNSIYSRLWALQRIRNRLYLGWIRLSVDCDCDCDGDRKKSVKWKKSGMLNSNRV